MKKIILSLLLILAASIHVEARPGRGGISIANSSCPQGNGTPGDGCASANQNALFINTNFFNNMRQSGQSAYVTRAPWNVAGVDYPVGQITPDAQLIDARTNAIPGCSINVGSRYQRCNAGVTVSGYRFNGIGLFVLTQGVNITDSHFTMTADNCRSYGGSGMVAINGGVSSDSSVTNSTFDFDDGCKMNSDLYKTAYDPGFVTQSSVSSVTITPTNPGATLVVNAASTGKMRVGQYMDCPGCNTGVVQLSILTAPAPVTISSISISGNIATVTTSTAHGLDVGAGLSFINQSPAGYQGFAEVISVPDSTHFTYQIPAGNVVPTNPATSVGTYGITYLSGASTVGSTWTVTLAKRATINGVTISGTTLHYTTRVGTETVDPGDEVIIPGVVPNTLIVGPTTGTNNYTVSISQTISTPVNGNTYKYTPAVTAVAGTTGPVLTNENGPLALAANNSKVTLKYNANLGSGQFASASADLDARWNYEEIVSQTGQHVNFVFNNPVAGTYGTFREDFNTVAWRAEAEDGGTGTFDYFTTSTSGATNGMVTLGELSLSNNTVIANKSNLYNDYNTNSVIRFLSQGGSAPGKVANTISYNLNTVPGSGIVQVTAIALTTAGVGLSPQDFLYCGGSFPTCNVPLRIIAQLTGTGGAPCPDVTCDGTTGTYSTSNTVDSFNKVYTNAGAFKYPGEITLLNANDNYMDITGTQGSAYNFDIAGVPVGTLNSTGNKLMTNGNSCNFGGSC